jgi:hypothetical protein
MLTLESLEKSENNTYTGAFDSIKGRSFYSPKNKVVVSGWS